MHPILLFLPVLSIMTVATAAERTTNPRTTTYAWIPKPATLLSEIPGSGVCDREIEYCMKVRIRD